MSKCGTNLVVSRQSFFSGIGFGTTYDLAAVNRIVCVDPGVPLEMLLSGEGLVTIRTIINSFYLLPTRIPLYLSIGDISLVHKGWLL